MVVLSRWKPNQYYFMQHQPLSYWQTMQIQIKGSFRSFLIKVYNVCKECLYTHFSFFKQVKHYHENEVPVMYSRDIHVVTCPYILKIYWMALYKMMVDLYEIKLLFWRILVVCSFTFKCSWERLESLLFNQSTTDYWNFYPPTFCE